MALPSLTEAGSGGFDSSSRRVNLIGGGPFCKGTKFSSYDAFVNEFNAWQDYTCHPMKVRREHK